MPRNIAVGIEWLRRSAQQGVAEARKLICTIQPVELIVQNSAAKELIATIRCAALAGDDAAQWTYIELLDRAPQAVTDESPQACEIATLLLKQLAQAGRVEAQWKLSQWQLILGQPHVARQWARSAAEQGHLQAQVWLAMHPDDHESPAFFDAVSEQAVLALIKPEASVDSRACELLVRYYKAHGWDNERGRAALIKAAERGHTSAAWELGRLHLNATQFTPRNKIASHDSIAAARLIATDPPERERPVSSFRTAIKWLTQAALGGCADAAYLLGIVHRMPACSKRNLTTSTEWLQRAAGAGQGDALHTLGLQHWRMRSAGFENQVLAIRYLSHAAANGHVNALAQLTALDHHGRDGCDWPCELFDEASIDAIGVRQPYMALRIALGRMFGLKRLELLLIDWHAADREYCVQIDLSAWTPKHTRRAIPILRDEQRRLLDAARYRMREVNSGPQGVEGNYRRRLYLFQKLIKQARLNAGLADVAPSEHAPQPAAPRHSGVPAMSAIA